MEVLRPSFKNNTPVDVLTPSWCLGPSFENQEPARGSCAKTAQAAASPGLAKVPQQTTGEPPENHFYSPRVRGTKSQLTLNLSYILFCLHLLPNLFPQQPLKNLTGSFPYLKTFKSSLGLTSEALSDLVPAPSHSAPTPHKTLCPFPIVPWHLLLPSPRKSLSHANHSLPAYFLE